ncbi:MAG TPA: vWA domain-containing protein, partial [bacterium]|nr:vWA domain-containing protein [bacterium]
MIYAKPDILWLLLLMPLIWIVHFRGRPLPSLSVSSVTFWRGLRAETTASKRKRTIHWLAVLVETLFLSTFILAWSEPTLRQSERLPEMSDVIIVVDNSLSMSSMESQKEIRTAYARLLDTLAPDSRVNVVSWSDRVIFVANGTPSNAHVRRVLEQIAPVRASNRMDRLTDYVHAFRTAHPESHCILLSDGRFQIDGSTDVPEFLYCPIQSNGDNIALTEVSAKADTLENVLLHVHCKSFSEQTVTGTLRVLSKSRTVASVSVTIPAGSESITAIEPSVPLSEISHISLDVTDTLGLDNVLS